VVAVIQSGMVSFHPALEPLMGPIDDLQPHPQNYNNGDTDEIGNSILTNGMYRPVYFQKSTGYILAGNHTWTECKELGAEIIPRIELDVDDVTALRILTGDNLIAALARPDRAMLLNILEIIDRESGLMGSGAKPEDLELLRKLSEIPLDHDEFGQWPTICVQVPPHVKNAYYTMTESAQGDRERFELLLRLAGWNGKK
jgi:hypothetical protein